MSRVIEQMELASKLLEEAGSVGLWIKADDCSDNRERRRLLREADWAASDAFRHATECKEELRVLLESLEPLPDMVTDIMLDLPPALEDKIRAAQEQIQQILERVRSA